MLSTPQDLPSSRTAPAGLALFAVPPVPPLGQSRSTTDHTSWPCHMHPSGVQPWAGGTRRSLDPHTTTAASPAPPPGPGAPVHTTPHTAVHSPKSTRRTAPATRPLLSSLPTLLGAPDAQTAHHATSSTAPAHQPLGSANAETTPATAPAAAADRTQRPDATCEGKNG